MPNARVNFTKKFDENLNDLNLCRILRNAPVKNIMLKDGRKITDATVWRELNQDLPLTEDNARTYSLIQAYLKSGNENVRKYLASVEWDAPDVLGDCKITLSRAVASNNPIAVENLLRNGADPNIDKDIPESTPLIEASKEGLDQIVEILLKYGANVAQTTTPSCYTALHYAAANGHLNCVKLLLKYDSPMEEQNENGHTPLMEATSNGHIEVARCLIENGANINTHSSEFKESALTLASYKGHAEMVKFLLDAGASHEHRTDEMHTALMEAAMEGHVDVARLLLDHGANVNIPQDSFESPLTLAACGGHTELVTLLIGYEADIEEVNDEGYTPLMEAAREGHEDTVAALLAAGADVNAKTDETQETALTLAACGGSIAICQMLLNAGADMEVGGNGCSTALMEAAQEGHVELVRRLLGMGANVHAMTTSGDTALHYAAENGHFKVCQELIKWGAGPTTVLANEAKTPLMKAARSGHLDVVQLLVECGFPIDQTTSKNDATALSLACNGGHAEVVEYLLRMGADLYHELNDGCTMIIECARSGSPTVARLLIDYPHSLHVPLAVNAPAPMPPQSLHQPPHLLPQQQLRNGGSIPMEVPKAAALAASTLQHKGAVQMAAQPDPKLKEALVNAYAIGWADGAASRTQQQAGSLQASGDMRMKLHKSVVRSNEEVVIDGPVAADLAQIPCTEDFTSRLMTLIQDWKGDGAEFISRLDNFMGPSTASAASLLCPRNQDAVVNNQLQQRLMFSPPPPPPSLPATAPSAVAPSSPYSSPSSKSSSSGAVQTTRSSASSTTSCSSNSSVINANSQLVDDPSVVAPLHQAGVYYQPQTGIPLCSLEPGRQRQQPPGAPVVPTLRTAYLQPPIPMSSNASAAHVPGMDPVFFEKFMACNNASNAAAAPMVSAHQPPPPPPPATVQPPNNTSATPRVQQVDINAYTESSNESALTLACNGGFTDLARLLLERGADKEHRDKKSHTPLHTAVYANQRAIVNLLLEFGADIEAQVERTKDTALSIACSHGRLEIAEDLLARGANKEHRNFSDYTPLSLAASGGFVDVIQLLLKNGAEINSRTGSKLGISPLMLASMNGYTEAVKVLLENGSDINAQIETNRNTALTLACFQGQADVVKLLVERKANIEHRAKTGLTPLMEAASGNHTKVGAILLSHGADVNSPPVQSSRDTALTIAADKGKAEFVKLLLDHKANVEAKNKKGATSMWLACNGGHLEVVQKLIEKNADVNSQDHRKVSCLMAAFRKGHIKVVELLVKYVTQFPSDKDCVRQIKTVCNDADLSEKCQQCRRIISAAKEKQEGEARKNADNLLEQIEQEEEARANREAMQARKRERKRNKRKAKAIAAKAGTTPSDASLEADLSPDSPLAAKVETVSEDIIQEPPSPTPSTSKEHSDKSETMTIPNELLKRKNKQQVEQSTSKEVISESKKSALSSETSKKEKSRHKKQNAHQQSQQQTQRSKSAVASEIPESSVSPAVSLETDANDSPFWTSPAYDQTSDSTTGNDWMVAQPTSTNRSHRIQGDSGISSGDWRTTGCSGPSNSRKNKVSIPVQKHEIGKIIGQGGAVVSALRILTGIQIDIESARGDEVTERMVNLKGPPELVQQTRDIISDLLSGALAGNELIARVKSSKPTASTCIPTSTSTSATTRTPAITGTASRKVGSSTSSKLSSYVPTPPPLLPSKSANLPSTVKIPYSVSGTRSLAISNNSWGPAKKSDFATVAAGGAGSSPLHQQPKETKTRVKSTAPSQSIPVTYLSATLPSKTSDSSTSSAPVSTILDEQSFPPLSTSTISVSSVNTSVTSKIAQSSDSSQPDRKTTLPTSQVETAVPFNTANSTSSGSSSATAIMGAGASEAKTRKQIIDVAGVVTSRDLPVPSSSTGFPTSISSVSAPLPQPIGSSRPFALAPGSERSANRHAGGSVLSTQGNKRLTPSTLSVPFASSGNDSIFSGVGTNFSTSNQPPQMPLGGDTMPGLFPTSPQQPSAQSFEFAPNSMWSNIAGRENFPAPNYEYLSGGRVTAANTTAAAGSNYPSMLPHPLESILNSASVDESYADSHLQSNYRLPQQSQSSAPVCKPSGTSTSITDSSFLPTGFPSTQNRSGVFPTRDFSIFNGTGSTSVTASNSNNNNPSNNTFLANRLNMGGSIPTKSPQVLMQPPSHHSQPQQQYSMGLSSLDPLCFGGNGHHAAYPGSGAASSSYDFRGSGGMYQSSSVVPQRQQELEPQTHQPTPIGAERRRQQPQPPHGLSNFSPAATTVMDSMNGLASSFLATVSSYGQCLGGQQQQQPQHQVPPQASSLGPNSGNSAWSSQSMQSLQHQNSFWSQNLSGGLGVPNLSSQQQHQLSGAMPNLWFNQSTPGGPTNMGAGPSGSSPNWMSTIFQHSLQSTAMRSQAQPQPQALQADQQASVQAPSSASQSSQQPSCQQRTQHKGQPVQQQQQQQQQQRQQQQ
ncbi:hypothetical protein Aperf_G00000018490 [Anoplocephala perfoliata]